MDQLRRRSADRHWWSDTVTTLFTTKAALTSLRANSSDRFSDGLKRLYPTGKPITRLRFLGQQGGLFYYAAADDVAASMPVATKAPVAIGGTLSGKKV